MPIASLRSGSVYYSDFSSSSPHTIIFIHGLGSSQNFYFPLVNSLQSQQSRRLILLDTPGAARSPLPSTGVVTVQSLAATVLELLQHLKIEKDVTVVGHSMGCLVALHLAQMAQEIVEKVVLLGPVYPSQALAEVFEKRVGAVMSGGMETMAAIIPDAAVGSRASALTKAFIREVLMGQTPEGYAALCKAIATSTTGDLKTVKAKVLILAGEEDKSAPMEGSLRYQQEIEGAELKVLQGVGHWHVVEAPEDVAEYVREFL
ncbi:Alpha/Beta hydrolase protein [Pyronema omphalodes]|nr:Alpha/Beta hydrolase protein [Pyronema omphalodes]